MTISPLTVFIFTGIFDGILILIYLLDGNEKCPSSSFCLIDRFIGFLNLNELIAFDNADLRVRSASYFNIFT